MDFHLFTFKALMIQKHLFYNCYPTRLLSILQSNSVHVFSEDYALPTPNKSITPLVCQTTVYPMIHKEQQPSVFLVLIFCLPPSLSSQIAAHIYCSNIT